MAPPSTKRFILFTEAVLAVSFWGASFVATKIALRYVSPFTVIWLRFAMGVVILAGAVWIRGQFALPSRRELATYAMLGFLGITFHQWLQSTGLQTAQATTTAWIVATTPVFMAILGWAVLREQLNWLKWGGIGLAFLGVLLVVSKGDLEAISVGQIGTFGDFLVLLSAPNWAIFSVLSRPSLERTPASRMMLYVMATGWAFTSILFFGGPGLQELALLPWDGWGAIAFLGIACSGLAYIFWYDALQVLPASQVGAFLYLEPLVTVIVAGIVLVEPLLWASFAGGGLILVGVWLVNRR